MVEIYNSELLENAGLVAICDDDSVTIYTLAELTNGFKKGDIIVKKAEHLSFLAWSVVCADIVATMAKRWRLMRFISDVKMEKSKNINVLIL